jgi:hypothetical protein
LELAKAVKKKWYISLIVFSSLQIILAVLSLIGFFGYQSEGGPPSVGKSREQVQSWLDTSPTRQNLNAEIMGYDIRERDLVPTVYVLEIWVLVLGVFSLSAGAVLFGIASHYRRPLVFKQSALPNGGPAVAVGRSDVSVGPPSVS